MVLTLKPTRHRFRVNGNDMYAWCSLDTILLPGILEAEAEIVSNDPGTGETTKLSVNADQIIKVEPAGTVTSIFVPGKRRARAQGLSNTAICTIEEALSLVRQSWAEPARRLRGQAV